MCFAVRLTSFRRDSSIVAANGCVNGNGKRLQPSTIGLSPGACRDMDAIWQGAYEQSVSLEQADRMVRAIFREIDVLAQTPRLGSSYPRAFGRELRFAGIFSYCIVYRTVAQGTEVVAVLHDAGDLAALAELRLANKPHGR